MPILSVFSTISLDGYFCDAHNDMSWAHSDNPEWNAFVAANASGGGALLLGRVTYVQMAGFWTTPAAIQMMPEVARGMNGMPKYVASRTLSQPAWQNTTVISADLTGVVRKLKSQDGPNLAILGSGSVVAQLSAAGLIDRYQFAVKPLVLGAGRTQFAGLPAHLPLTRVSARSFANGNMVLEYAPAARHGA